MVEKRKFVEEFGFKKGAKIWAKLAVNKWHNQGIDYVFLNDTSATPLGYLVKETWKEAYGSKSMPKFYRIDPRKLDTAGKDSETVTNYFERRIKKKNPRIVVFDECGSSNYGPDNPGYYGSLARAGRFIQQHVPDAKIHLNGAYAFDDGAYSQDFFDLENVRQRYSRITGNKSSSKVNLKPTSKLKSTGRVDTKDEEDLYHKIRTGKIDPKKRLTGYIVKNAEQRGLAREFVSELKEIGREAGKELIEETKAREEEYAAKTKKAAIAALNHKTFFEKIFHRKKEDSLESRLIPVLVFGSCLGSLLFTSSTLTGNTIGSLSTASTNLIGIFLFMLGTTGTFFYIKKRKN